MGCAGGYAFATALCGLAGVKRERRLQLGAYILLLALLVSPGALVGLGRQPGSVWVSFCHPAGRTRATLLPKNPCRPPLLCPQVLGEAAGVLLLLTDNAWRARIPGGLCCAAQAVGRRCIAWLYCCCKAECLLACSAATQFVLLPNSHAPGVSNPCLTLSHLVSLTCPPQAIPSHSPAPRADDPSGRWRQAQQALADNPRTARLAAVGLLGAELLALAAACALQAIYQHAYEAWMDDREVGWA